ncbi:MAG TPA: LLM class flavin-dependent oxidoreductase [Candidatus Limnocylindrales bacterium]|nr:LLM class flavin-dependent oxidoreductase [Candidatus Limnocylindrales bacterium]
MPDMSAPLKLGADCWNSYTDWPAWLAAMQRAERLGYDSLWAPDHIYPPNGDPYGPCLEPYMAIAPVAAMTSRPSIGLMVGANTYRNPALVAKMVTTLDHISGGRAILAIGSAWNEIEHTGFGFDFGDSPGERLRWLREALPVIRGMLDGKRPSAAGGHYHMQDAVNEPLPLQAHLPILIGGSGRRVTLRLVAEHADICNIGGRPAEVREKDAVLVGHCEVVGRDEREIERSIDVGVPTIRDSRAEAEAFNVSIFEGHGGAAPWANQPVGTAEDVFERLAEYVALGYHHLVFYFPKPFDEETMTRLATEIRPRLQALIDRPQGMAGTTDHA